MRGSARIFFYSYRFGEVCDLGELRSDMARPRRRLGLAAATVALQVGRGLATTATERIGALHIVFGAANIPHPAKAKKGGEDAYFCDDRCGTFGVADGVGGSASAKVDPGLFSREVLRRCHAALAQPHDSLLHAMEAAAAKELTLGGSSTLLIGQLESASNTLRVSNLGDSGVMLLRPAFRRFSGGNFMWPRIVLRSFDQTHAFNTPYQTAADDFAQATRRSDQLSTAAAEGDILIAATDGVLDNLFDQHIQNVVARSLSDLRKGDSDGNAAQLAVDALADQIANEAHAIGLREDEEGLHTPFELAAAQERYKFLGGKLDDVAVVVGLVRAGEPPPEQRGLMSNF